MDERVEQEDRRRRRALILWFGAGATMIAAGTWGIVREHGGEGPATRRPAYTAPRQGVAGASAQGRAAAASAGATPSGPSTTLPAAAGGSSSTRAAGSGPGDAPGSDRGAAGVQVQAAGALELDGGAGRLAGVVLRNASPGQSAAASLRVRNTGASPLALRVRVRDVRDVPGPLGGLLSRRLRVRLADGGRTVLAGSPAGLRGGRDLGSVPAGGTRTLRLVLTFPDGGVPPSPTTGDNLVQGAAAGLVLEVTGRGRSRPGP